MLEVGNINYKASFLLKSKIEMYIEASLTFPNYGSEFEDGVKKEILKYLGLTFNRRLGSIQNRTKQFIKGRLLDQPVVQALQDPESLLVGELGLEDPVSKSNAIIDFLVDKFVLTYDFSNMSRANISFTLSETDINQVISLPEASYVSFNAAGEGVTIEWLRWLLFEGGAPIVIGWRYKPTTGRSGKSKAQRTGGGFMVPSSRAWSVPLGYRGTPDDNFITDAFEEIDEFVNTTIRLELTRGIGVKI